MFRQLAFVVVTAFNQRQAGAYQFPLGLAFPFAKPDRIFMAADDAPCCVSFVGRDALDRRFEEGALLERESVAIAKVIDVAALLWKREFNLDGLRALNVD